MPNRLIPSPDYAAGLGEVKSRNLRNMKRLFSAGANVIIWQRAVAKLALGLPARRGGTAKKR